MSTAIWTSASLRWSFPVAVGLVGVAYQIALGESHSPTPSMHLEFAADMVLFAVVNPLLAFLGVRELSRIRARAAAAERRAAGAERMLRGLDDASPDAIIMLDNRGRVARWNKRAEELFGHSSQGAAQRRLADMLDGDRAASLGWQRFQNLLARHGSIERYEILMRGRDGKEILVEANGKTLLDGNGRPWGMAITVRDVTARARSDALIRELDVRLSESAVRLAHANEQLECMAHARTEVLSFIAHEIRLPLGNVLAGTERLRQGCDEPVPTCSRGMEVIRKQASLLDTLVRKVLDAARMETGAWTLSREYVPIDAIIRDAVCAFVGDGSDRAIHVELPQSGATTVDADRDRIVQVLCNLLSNAAKYSPPGAAIDIAVESDAGCVTVRVRDHGPGIPRGCPQRVFEKFFRAPGNDSAGADGHGLGLYICRQIVCAHDGRIWAENHPDGGAVFSFTLPTAE